MGIELARTNRIIFELKKAKINQLPKESGIVAFHFLTGDPIHVGHFEIARRVIQLGSQTILFPIMNYYPERSYVTYKPKHPAPYKHREKMLKLALTEIAERSFCQGAALGVLKLHGEEENPERLFGNLREIAQDFSSRIIFVIGSDTLMNGRFQELTKPFAPWLGLRLLVNERVNLRVPNLDLISDQLGFAAELHRLERIGISSSSIRDSISRGVVPSNVIPRSVELYIRKNSLYTT